MDATIMQRALLWAASSDTGRSSKAILAVMAGGMPEDDDCHPHDDDDLGRCVRLLDQIPEWQPRIGEMAAVSKEWAALSAIWAELVTLHREKKTMEVYDRIKSVTRPLEKGRDNMVRFGEHASMHFGRRRPGSAA